MGEHGTGAEAVIFGRGAPLQITATRERLQLAAALIALNVADVITTRAVLDRGGIEANPLMVGLMQGFAAPLLVKTVVAAIAGLLLLCCPPASRRAERATAAVIGLYMAIVVWNMGVFLLLGVR